MNRVGPIAISAAAGAALLAAAAGGRWARPIALINESPSLPEGVYLRAPGPVALGSIVAIRQPPAARAYLATLGMPENVSLLKRVVAAAGDRVCSTAGGVTVRGQTIPARPRDRRGAPLPNWRGCRRLAPDELFLLGDTAASFDSRYFGPVRRAEADGPYRKVLQW